MLNADIVLSSAGSLSVAVIALYFFVFQGWIYLKGLPFPWSKWGALLSLASFIYAVTAFIQYNSAPDLTNHIAELFQYSIFILLVHAVYGFTFSYLDINPRRYHQIAGPFHLILLTALWGTDLVINNEFTYRSFLWLDRPYVEPELGVLGPFFIVYWSLAATICLTCWIRKANPLKSGARTFICGLLFWALLGIHDAAATLGFQTVQFLMEYGFLGFSTSILCVTLKNYMNLVEKANNRKKALQKVNRELEKRVQERTGELEDSNAELVAEIEQRKWANEALRESEQRFRTAFHTSPDAININKLTGEFVEINEGFTTLTGYTRADVIGVSSTDVQIWVIPEDRKKVIAALNKAGFVDNLESQFSCKNGDVKPGLISARIINLNGENHVLTITRDISKWKKVEADKKKLEAQLQRAQKMEAIGTLAGGVAHDLNNILSGIVSYPELILMDLPEDSDLREPIETIQNSGSKAAAIVHDLLTLARRGVSISEVVNLNQIVSEHLESPEFKKIKQFHPGVEVEVHPEADLLNISGSPVHLSKMVMNLIANAAEAMVDGGTVRISTQNIYLDQPVAGYIEIEEGDYALLKFQTQAWASARQTRNGFSSLSIPKR